MPAPENLETQTPGALTEEAAPHYTAKHKGGGKWIVTDVHGAQVGDFSGDKDEAAAEVARLLAGGLPLASYEPDLETPVQAKAAIDPHELKAPVLTEEGWVCPAPKEA